MYLNFSKFWRPGRCGSVVVLKGERLGNERSGSRFGCDPGLRFSFSAGQKFAEAKKWQRPFTKGTTAAPPCSTHFLTSAHLFFHNLVFASARVR